MTVINELSALITNCLTLISIQNYQLRTALILIVKTIKLWQTLQKKKAISAR